MAFWLAVFDAAQVVGRASQKKAGLAKLWWKMTEIDIPPLPPEATREIVETYIVRQGMPIESPGLFVGHAVKQSGGNPQAIADRCARERLGCDAQIICVSVRQPARRVYAHDNVTACRDNRP